MIHLVSFCTQQIPNVAPVRRTTQTSTPVVDPLTPTGISSTNLYQRSTTSRTAATGSHTSRHTKFAVIVHYMLGNKT